MEREGGKEREVCEGERGVVGEKKRQVHRVHGPVVVGWFSVFRFGKLGWWFRKPEGCNRCTQGLQQGSEPKDRVLERVCANGIPKHVLGVCLLDSILKSVKLDLV